ncbi:hypothetical protein EYS09_30350 [Streptomyces kasugaensis]|uniref:Uncharacterized protein n=1 Tax=Streptomyces kasugaensis TaxID=1946 RepID=A0A4Q9HMC6_STRKA|nr:hypothetical protein EYS09_30350 [Streptomyces kasugaensis]
MGLRAVHRAAGARVREERGVPSRAQRVRELTALHGLPGDGGGGGRRTRRGGAVRAAGPRPGGGRRGAGGDPVAVAAPASGGGEGEQHDRNGDQHAHGRTSLWRRCAGGALRRLTLGARRGRGDPGRPFG